MANFIGGDETRSGYVRYVQGIQPNVPAHTMCRHGLYNSVPRSVLEVRTCTIELYRENNPSCAGTNIPLSSAQIPTSF